MHLRILWTKHRKNIFLELYICYLVRLSPHVKSVSVKDHKLIETFTNWLSLSYRFIFAHTHTHMHTLLIVLLYCCLTITRIETACPALCFNRSALLPPDGWRESYTVAQLPLRRTGALRPDAPIRHGAACKGGAQSTRATYTQVLTSPSRHLWCTWNLWSTTWTCALLDRVSLLLRESAYNRSILHQALGAHLL